MNSIRAYAPANISCIFKPVIGKDELHTGSTGLGFTLNEGVIVEVSFSRETEVFFNGKRIDFPTVNSVINILTTCCHKVSISSSLPLGCGFGISGASALATAYAFNVLLELKKDSLDLAKIAHTAEVGNGTGLGDITNQYLGGCLLKTKPSYMFEAQKLLLDGTKVYCKVFTDIETKKILADVSIQNKIVRAADETLKEIELRIKNPFGSERQVFDSEVAQTRGGRRHESRIIFSDIIQISKQFALQSGLLKNKEVKETIADIEKKGGFASMIMLGNAVFSNIPFKGAKKHKISSNKASIIL